MTREQAQLQAPSYLHLPNDGDLFRCDECKVRKSYKQVIITFTPDGKFHYPICLECVDEHWFKNAKDCGMVD
jgi:hypothetical protein